MSEMVLEDLLIGLALRPRDTLPETARALARLSLLDWLVCGAAGVGEPLAGKLRAWAKAEGSAPRATLFGGGQGSERVAAYVNGAVSHALDFDDTHFAHIGHLSVGLFPAVFAVAEARGLDAALMIDAFVVGAEAAIRVGLALGPQHYNMGFHQTATAGAFGATLAAGRLMGLEQEQLRHALGLCATRASGLKSQFGTMGKPLNAGIAASNGVEAASLAALGFTSADHGLTGDQGFLATHSSAPEQPTAFDRFLFEDNLYKFHACCHGTHAMIEALLETGVTLPEIDAVTVETNPRWLLVCDQKSPRTGLEVKFSYAWLAGMTLRGDPTSDRSFYTDTLASDPDLARFAARVTVTGDPALTDLQARVVLQLATGAQMSRSHDLAAPVSIDTLGKKLRAKAAQALPDGKGAEIWDMLDGLDSKPVSEIARQILV